jgi:hypothetical protein
VLLKEKLTINPVEPDEMDVTTTESSCVDRKPFSQAGGGWSLARWGTTVVLQLL